MIEPHSGYNIGDKPVTHRQAANAIYNKLSIAFASSYGRMSQQAEDAVKEALFLADAIVREQSAKDEGTQRYFDRIKSLEDVKPLGDQMAGLTRTQAEELRRYLVEKYKILPGCVEGLVWQKYGKDGRNEAVSDEFIMFARQFIASAQG